MVLSLLNTLISYLGFHDALYTTYDTKSETSFVSLRPSTRIAISLKQNINQVIKTMLG